MLKRIFKVLLSRRLIVFVLLLVQLLLLSWFVWGTSINSRIIVSVLNILSVFLVVYVVNRRDKPAYKIAWIILMLTFPVFGGLLYLIINLQVSTGGFRKFNKHYEDLSRSYLKIDENIIEEFNSVNPGHLPQVNYLTNYARFPMYKNTKTEYLSPGEKFFPVFISELEKAEKFIFMEFFIIAKNRMWNDTLEILKRKVSQGVEVRLMYDDIGCITLLDPQYKKEIESYGIKCTVFNPFRPLWSSVQNNRDHRKITVIDGKVAFTGGVNLADEYINELERFGYWQDCAAMIKGDAVRSFTVMFLQLWNASNRTNEDFGAYLPEISDNLYNDGYFLPYSDSPYDDENVCEHVYMQILNNAKKYVYIQTPYFIIDDSMLSAFILAAKSGVDVRIITPHIPDKKLVHMTTRSYYHSLITAGVRVYEFTPGFIHSKTVVSDDDTATIGTANFDFRSLYLHFECGELIFNSSIVSKMKEDFLALLPKCREITIKDTKRNIFVRLGQSILRIFAPLL